LGGLAFLLAWQIPWDMGLAPFAYPIAVVILAWLGRALRGWWGLRRRIWGPPTSEIMELIISTPARAEDMDEKGDDGDAEALERGTGEANGPGSLK
ncbi:MAG TPA: hypothetical protein VM389_02120, partial [Phycisphaerae bacterium]|nr:hypothetical protein [Phycisphaerae bacterium]